MIVENITNAEWEIMRVVWAKEQTTSSEITELLQTRLGWKSSTVKTLLNRLVEKDFLKTKKDGKRFIYSANVTETTSAKSLAEDAKEKICARNIPLFIEEMIATSDFTMEDLEQLEEIIKEKRKVAVKQIACNCLPDNCCC